MAASSATLRRAISSVGRAPHEHAGRLQLGRQVGELPLNRLEVADRLAERVARARVRERLVERGLSDAERLRGNGDPPALERPHRQAEAAPNLTEHRVGADADVLEVQVHAAKSAHAE